jgi:hypothetical protein
MTTTTDKGKPITWMLAVAAVVGGLTSAVTLGKQVFGASAVTSYQVERLTDSVDKLNAWALIAPKQADLDAISKRVDLLNGLETTTHDAQIVDEGRIKSIEDWKQSLVRPQFRDPH